MSEKEVIVADGTPHEVEVKPLTLVCHPGEVKVDVPGRVEINPEATVACARSLSEEEWVGLSGMPDFLDLWKLVWGDFPFPAGGTANLGHLHTVGLILLLAECILERKQPFIRLPETYLHPKQQAGLADLFVRFSSGPNK